ATQRVAERVAEAPLERFNDDARLARSNGLHLDDAGLQELGNGSLHCGYTLPVRTTGDTNTNTNTINKQTRNQPCHAPDGAWHANQQRLLRIQLDDEVLVDVGENVIPARRRLEHTTEFLVVHLDPLGQTHLGRNPHGRANAQLLARLLADLDDIARLHLVGGDRHRLVVDVDGLVAHELPRFGARRGKSHAVNDIIQPALQQLEQGLTGRALLTSRLGVVVAELPLQDAV